MTKGEGWEFSQTEQGWQNKRLAVAFTVLKMAKGLGYVCKHFALLSYDVIELLHYCDGAHRILKKA